MTKNTKKSKKGQVQFNAIITSKFDLVVLEPDLGFYYLNLYDRGRKAQIYWCYEGDEGGIMRINQTGIAQKNPPHYNIVLPDTVDALALRRLVARLDTSLLRDSKNFGLGEKEDGSLYIGCSDDTMKWMNQLDEDIQNLPVANCIRSFLTIIPSEMQSYLDSFDMEITASNSEEEVRDMARVLGERIVAEKDVYSWRLPWVMLELWKTLRGVDREKEKREAETMAIMFSGYRKLKLEDVIFHENVAVNM